MEANDGCFWMCTEDFVEHFNTFYKCAIMGQDIKKIGLEVSGLSSSSSSSSPMFSADSILFMLCSILFYLPSVLYSIFCRDDGKEKPLVVAYILIY